ncbi:hypothetical protein FRC19_001184 [Serendipita sp. 401]|nr:hypothetical protein FRC19_001184 [Serendipita sp. 401]
MAFQYSSAEEALCFLTWKRLFTVTVLAVLGPPLLKLARRIIRSRFSPLRVIPGPGNGHIVFGHMKKIRTRKQGLWHEEMIQRYGHVIKYKAYFGVDRVYTTDTKAVNYVLNHSMVYRKPDQTRFMLSRILGDGLLFVEGKVQASFIHPVFSHLLD